MPAGNTSNSSMAQATHKQFKRAEKVLQSQDIKILWDSNIKIDRVIETKHPDIMFIDKKNQETLIIDVAIPGDLRVRDK